MAPRLDVVEKLNDRNISIDGKAENSRFVVPNTYQGTLTLRIIGMQTRNRPATYSRPVGLTLEEKQVWKPYMDGRSKMCCCSCLFSKDRPITTTNRT